MLLAMNRKQIRICALAALLGCAAGPATAQRIDPSTLPARDTHEGVTVAVDPYTDAARSKERFGKKHPHLAGILLQGLPEHDGQVTGDIDAAMDSPAGAQQDAAKNDPIGACVRDKDGICRVR